MPKNTLEHEARNASEKNDDLKAFLCYDAIMTEESGYPSMRALAASTNILNILQRYGLINEARTHSERQSGLVERIIVSNEGRFYYALQ